MRPGWKSRALVWLALVESVRANVRAYPDLPTAWLPHAVGNSVALWLPELLVTLETFVRSQERRPTNPTLKALYRTSCDLCRDNPRWGLYVAAAALGYALSHPRFNIYKGELGERRFLGFGLDAIPHSMTAFSLALLVQDGITLLGEQLPEESSLAPLIRRLAAHPTWLSGAVLALLSTLWETSEYAMQKEELRRKQGDYSAINMEWGAEDMFFDLASNTLGWATAAWYWQRKMEDRGRPLALDPSAG